MNRLTDLADFLICYQKSHFGNVDEKKIEKKFPFQSYSKKRLADFVFFFLPSCTSNNFCTPQRKITKFSQHEGTGGGTTKKGKQKKYSID